MADHNDHPMPDVGREGEEHPERGASETPPGDHEWEMPETMVALINQYRMSTEEYLNELADIEIPGDEETANVCKLQGLLRTEEFLKREVLPSVVDAVAALDLEENQAPAADNEANEAAGENSAAPSPATSRAQSEAGETERSDAGYETAPSSRASGALHQDLDDLVLSDDEDVGIRKVIYRYSAPDHLFPVPEAILRTIRANSISVLATLVQEVQARLELKLSNGRSNILRVYPGGQHIRAGEVCYMIAARLAHPRGHNTRWSAFAFTMTAKIIVQCVTSAAITAVRECESAWAKETIYTELLKGARTEEQLQSLPDCHPLVVKMLVKIRRSLSYEHRNVGVMAKKVQEALDIEAIWFKCLTLATNATHPADQSDRDLKQSLDQSIEATALPVIVNVDGGTQHTITSLKLMWYLTLKLNPGAIARPTMVNPMATMIKKMLSLTALCHGMGPGLLVILHGLVDEASANKLGPSLCMNISQALTRVEGLSVAAKLLEQKIFLPTVYDNQKSATSVKLLSRYLRLLSQDEGSTFLECILGPDPEEERDLLEEAMAVSTSPHYLVQRKHARVSAVHFEDIEEDDPTAPANLPPNVSANELYQTRRLEAQKLAWFDQQGKVVLRFSRAATQDPEAVVVPVRVEESEDEEEDEGENEDERAGSHDGGVRGQGNGDEEQVDEDNGGQEHDDEGNGGEENHNGGNGGEERAGEGNGGEERAGEGNGGDAGDAMDM